jgi:hypothetical protein
MIKSAARRFSLSREDFSAEDVAWLLEHAPGEIVVLRPEDDGVVEPVASRSQPD